MWRLLLPGFKLKRFMLLVAVGFMAIGGALGEAILSHRVHWRLDLPIFLAGLAVVGLGTWGMGAVMADLLGSDQWAGQWYSRRQLARGPRVTALGGGTGLPVVLRGLKEYTSNLTAVVTVADDGGSSGRLRGDLGVLPPGDIRNCMVALADTEPLMEELFQHRFETGELKGHSFGNLFLAAMERTAGDFVTALRESSRVLAVRGTVLPATLDRVNLWAELATGVRIEGESNIGKSSDPIVRVGMEPSDATPLAETIQAIKDADMVVLGPGSLYTSIIPNLLVTPIGEALKNSRAVRVYVANLMTQPGETTHFSFEDHLDALERHVGSGLVDVVLVNNQMIDALALEKYRQEGAEPVFAPDGGSRPGLTVVSEPLIAVDGVIRHDPQKLALALLRLMVRFKPGWSHGHAIDGLWLDARLRQRRRSG